MPFVTVKDADGGHRMYYRLLPEAKSAPLTASELSQRPRVLLLMGLGGFHQYWLPQMQYLSSFCCVCLPDNRGVGYSTSPAGQWRWTTKQLAKDAQTVLDDLHWFERVHIVGISMGGMIAQELASAVPGRVASLTLLSTYASALHALPSWNAMFDLAKGTGLVPCDQKERARAGLRLNFPDEWLSQSRSSDLHDGQLVSNERWVRKYNVLMALDVPLEMQRPPDPPALSSMLRQLTAVLTHRFTAKRCESLLAYKVPVRVVTGDQDWLVRPVNSEQLAELFNVSITVLEGCGHGAIHQQPETVNGVLEAAIREGESRLASRRFNGMWQVRSSSKL